MEKDCGPLDATSNTGIQEIQTRAQAVLDKLDLLTAQTKNPTPNPYDDRNIDAGDLDSLKLGGSGGGGGGECNMDLTIQANNYVINATAITIDQCSTPTTVTFTNNVNLINIQSVNTNITSTGLNITTAGTAVVIDGTTWQSILDRLTAAESSISTLQSAGYVTQTDIDNSIATHSAETTGVHGL